MRGVIRYCTFFSCLNALAAGLFYGGGDYSRCALASGLCVLFGILGNKMRKPNATLKSGANLFAGLAAIFFMIGVDYAMDKEWGFAMCNFFAFGFAAGFGLWIVKRT